ncbi:hypothetical protein KL918_002863 [Ogataea parapolymorpha]|uniref:Secreted protein n=1 Tax=Ogataea parapolymorpha (strain ATCC 26012 / BCRC 20466 / JCM 22074 / NRRL Y-7560 / DL-1) TaxID=871575 RepID=W1QJQ8_OGAPD|nr:putative secreted protein [Ogataea parapolymorpha DL-1]ESX01224.1 putative secreted protein [Ogataea parapolymorpha DL-1]KAG7867424.1 hypothetical protein KL918_002863 [Ogataea parapolymorpha]KAG7871810.1 hypothetical protein KL916_003660 [Ogataea parapolymorpha]
MKATILSSLLLALGSFALPVPKKGYHDVETAARVARTLVNRESLANLATIQKKDGVPVSFMEYYADCQDDGEPIFLLVNISSSQRNIDEGSKVSVSIRVGDHPINDHVNPHYIGGRVRSAAGSPRVNLKGSFVPVAGSPELDACFALRHHDAPAWYPGSPVHSTFWAKFHVEEVYIIGGFGDAAYIGEIPADLYLNATTFDDEELSEELSSIIELPEQENTYLTRIVKAFSRFFGLQENEDEEQEGCDFEEEKEFDIQEEEDQEEEEDCDFEDEDDEEDGEDEDDEDDENDEEDEDDEDDEDDEEWKQLARDQKKFWKHYGKEQKKYWKSHGDEPEQPEDPECEEVAEVEDPDYWKKHGKDQKKFWKHYGKEQKKHWKSHGDQPEDPENPEDAEVEVMTEVDDPDYWKHYGKDQKKYWKHYGKEQKKYWKSHGKDDDGEQQVIFVDY